ncbi:carbohydrate ABC transporter permease [Vallitalea okinawensis]|uniref:carbohydrate ABC transporter permease n=1 Tax=Vallitalea okinawensis TaxID=2078660 RepID=UPI000CFCFA03|nr:sugar ABC transporter permease [Vallitalea okinawensis]
MIRTTQKNNWSPHIGILPGVALFIIFVIIPTFYNFYFALTDYNGFPNSEVNVIGFKNFIDAFTINKDITMNALKNSLIYATLITSIQNIVAVVIAIMLTFKIKNSNFFRGLYFFPNVLGAFIIASIWSLLMNPNFGPVSKLFELVGMKVNLLGNPNLSIYAVIFVQVWASMGYAMIIYYTNVKSIPSDSLEASDIDGANTLQKIKHIILPLLMPSFTINILLSLIGSLKLFELIFIMTTGGPARSSENLPVLIFNEAFSFGKHGYAAALNVIQFFMILGISVVIMLLLRRREVEY